MLKCYVDDSGSDPQPDGLYVLAGYIMDERRWEEFAELWDERLKERPSIDYCRMSDAEAPDGQFLNMRLEFREYKVKSLANVIRHTQPTAIASVMSWADYNEAVKGKVDLRLDNPYAILFFKIMALVSEIQLKADAVLTESHGVNPFGGPQPVDFIFDDQGPAGLKCLDWYGALRERVQEPHRTMIANTPQFKDDRKLVPLQAADMLAWYIRREHSFPNENRSDVFDRLIPAGLCQYDVSRKELVDIVDTFNGPRLDRSSI